VPCANGSEESTTKEEFLSDAVDECDHENDPEISQSGVAEHILSEPGKRGNRANNEGAEHEERCQQQPHHNGCDDRTP
jgi:hypothetical protein